MKRCVSALTCLLLMLSWLPSAAQRLKTIEAEYTYIMPSSMTIDEARAIALERAIISGLEKEFGTIVSQTNTTMIEVENTRSKNSFYALAQSEVKGEWVRTLAERIDPPQTEDGHTYIKAWVKGEGREVTYAKTEFTTRLLRNGREDRFEDENFRTGDHLYITFQSPAKGFLAVYLLDKDRNATRIVPKSADEPCRVKRGEKFLFFDSPRERLVLYTDQPHELNQFYFVFSPNEFALPLDQTSTDNSDLSDLSESDFPVVSHLPLVGNKDFQKWLGSLRKKDVKAQVETKFVRISDYNN